MINEPPNETQELYDPIMLGYIRSVFGHFRNKIWKGTPNYDDGRVKRDWENTDYAIHKPVV